MTKIESSSHEDLLFDASRLAGYDEDCQWLVALSDWQLSVILSALRYANWSSRWVNVPGEFSEIQDKIYFLEHCLMSGCNVSDLIKVQRMLVAAIIGEAVDLTADPLLPDNIDYTQNGLVPTLLGLGGDQGASMDDLEEILDSVNVVLGAAAVLA